MRIKWCCFIVNGLIPLLDRQKLINYATLVTFESTQNIKSMNRLSWHTMLGKCAMFLIPNSTTQTRVVCCNQNKIEGLHRYWRKKWRSCLASWWYDTFNEIIEVDQVTSWCDSQVEGDQVDPSILGMPNEVEDENEEVVDDNNEGGKQDKQVDDGDVDEYLHS